MFLIAAVLLHTQAPAARPTPAEPTVQARATVRILSAAKVSFGRGSREAGGRPVQEVRTIRTNAGLQTAELVEFE
jgi:hypothetical protein